MQNPCKPVYLVNALPKLRFFSFWSRDVSFQRAVNHNLVLVVFLVLPLGTTITWDCEINSLWEEAPPVGGNPIFWQWDIMLLSSLSTFVDTGGKMWYNRVMLNSISQFIPDPALDLEWKPIQSERPSNFSGASESSFWGTGPENLYENSFVVYHCLTSLSVGCCLASLKSKT